jgi:hypothetical protein
LLVSWLLVAFIPGVLMLATFGLARLESGLVDDTLTARDVADFLAHAQPADVGTLARVGMTEALDCLHRRQTELGIDEPALRSSLDDYRASPVYVLAAEQPGPLSGRRKHSRANRQFGAPRHANRV